ncbi:MAG: hypothetical protein AAF907_01910, partial [Planctomycetota bacterium]
MTLTTVAASIVAASAGADRLNAQEPPAATDPGPSKVADAALPRTPLLAPRPAVAERPDAAPPVPRPVLLAPKPRGANATAATATAETQLVPAAPAAMTVERAGAEASETALPGAAVPAAASAVHDGSNDEAASKT